MASDYRVAVVKAKILVIGSIGVIYYHQSIKSTCIRKWIGPHIFSHLFFPSLGGEGTNIYLQSGDQAIGELHTLRLMTPFV